MSQAWSYRHQCPGMLRFLLTSVTFPTTPLYSRRVSQPAGNFPFPTHPKLENPGVPFYSSSSAPFFEKAVKMFELFWSSSFFPSLISFFSISLVIWVISDAGKTSLWSKTFPMIFRYYSAHFSISFTLAKLSCPCFERARKASTPEALMNSSARASYLGRQPGKPR